MTSPWLAALVALFVWWSSTGAILVCVRRADNAGGGRHLATALVALPILGLGLAGAAASSPPATVADSYTAFFSALAVWAWIELAFLTGVVAGPNRSRCPPGASGAERFLRSVGTIAWHELALIAALLALAWLSGGAGHAFAFWTFAVLFFARVSAKLNLFLGVPRVNVQFLPRPLAHLPSHFRIARMNWLFPVSVSLLTLAAFCFLDQTMRAATAGAATGFALLAALTVLALAEHWFMVLPLPDERLWRWMIPDAKPRPAARGAVRPTPPAE
ncbi:MAG: putative photosynthetic complex assembly protein PuhE [Rhodobacteraceae bacterium]|nr:putative photosynthetic complex assembly protein PuhE [Paracoccaceae bacterium]